MRGRRGGDQSRLPAALAPYDFTRGGGYYHYSGRADIKELALYVQDQIKAGNWTFNLGIRGDLYNGLTIARQAEPRLGVFVQRQAVRHRAQRLVRAHAGDAVQREPGALEPRVRRIRCWSPLLSCSSGVSNAEQPGYRNEFHASLQQAAGKHVIVSGEYIWKYTHNAFDFSVLGNTPITFPIDWHNSKIPGYALHVDVPTYHNFNAYSVMSSVAARFFPPQVAGAGATVGKTGLAVPHRSRRALQPDHSPAVHLRAGQIPERPVGRIQLALRLGPGRGLGALLQPALATTPTAPAMRHYDHPQRGSPPSI